MPAMPARSRPYLRVDVLDHLLAPLVLEVDVDVGRLGPLGGDEALEQQAAAHRIDLGDAEAVADRGIGRRAAALAEDALRARIAHDVVDGEEIGRVVALRDQREFVREALPDRVVDALGVTRGRALPGEVLERRLRRGEALDLFVGIFVFQFVEREGERLAQSAAFPRSPRARRGTAAPFPRAA